VTMIAGNMESDWARRRYFYCVIPDTPFIELTTIEWLRAADDSPAAEATRPTYMTDPTWKNSTVLGSAIVLSVTGHPDMLYCRRSINISGMSAVSSLVIDGGLDHSSKKRSLLWLRN